MPREPGQLLDPPVDRAAYSARSAWIMARCSELGYVPFENGPAQIQHLRHSLNDLRLELLAPFQVEATTGYVANSQRYAVLASRGTTKDMRNILTDINVRFYRDPQTNAKIAAGFGQAFALVKSDISAAISQIDRGLPLYITGHSLGGALAVIASARIEPSDRVAACYTFGCPRVGTAEFADELWKVPVYRLVHSADIVPRVPPPFGYRHAGDMRYIKRNGKMMQGPNSVGLFFSFAYTFATGWKNVFLDHRIANYTSNLQAWALKRLDLEQDSTSPQAPAQSKTLAASPGATR